MIGAHAYHSMLCIAKSHCAWCSVEGGSLAIFLLCERIVQKRGNLWLAYFLILLQVERCTRLWGSEWEAHWWPLTTTRNTLALIGHAITGLAEDSSRRQEIAIEQHFSRVKSACRGQPSLKDGIYGTVRTHLRQAASLTKGVTPKVPSAKGVSPSSSGDGAEVHESIALAELRSLADRSLKLACLFQRFLDPGAEALDVAGLKSWWKASGCQLLTKTSEFEDGEFDDGCSSEEEVQEASISKPRGLACFYGHDSCFSRLFP